MNQIKYQGAGLEVGRSCIVLEFKGKTVMFDCGLHIGKNGQDSLPYFDYIDPSKVDILFISHFHLDHCGAVVYFLEKTNFKGKVFMTFPTKAIFKLIMADSIKLNSNKCELQFQLYSKQELQNCYQKITPIDFHQEREHNGIKFKCFTAGHVIGAAMFLVEIEGIKILYTGDYSCENERYIAPAEVPDEKIDILIVESTYGIKTHEPRDIREEKFTSKVKEVLENGGNCLLPVFVTGRAQELLLILDEYWQSNQSLQQHKILFPCALALKCMEIYQAYLNMLGPIVKNKFRHNIDPFQYKFVQMLKNLEGYNFDDQKIQSVIMSAPGSMKSGMSRIIFEKWCHNPKNAVFLTGYCVEGTLAMQLQSNPQKILKLDGKYVDMKMQVEINSFSAHADYKQTKNFIENLHPSNIVLVHGEKSQCEQLCQKLKIEFPDITVVKPENTQKIEFYFIQQKKKCYVEGQLLTDIQKTLNQSFDNQQLKKVKQEQDFQQKQEISIEGYLINQENQYLMKYEDAKQYLKCTPPLELNCKMYKEFEGSLNLIKFLGSQIFSNVSQTEKQITANKKIKYVKVGEYIYISKQQKKDKSFLKFEWISNEQNDLIIENLSLLLAEFSSKSEDIFDDEQYQQQQQLDGNNQNYNITVDLLRQNFPEQFSYDENLNTVHIQQKNGEEIIVKLNNNEIHCKNEIIKNRILALLNNNNNDNYQFDFQL